MNQNSIDESNDFGDADDWMMAMRRLSEQLLYGLESLTAKPDAQSLNNLLFIASLQSGVEHRTRREVAARHRRDQAARTPLAAHPARRRRRAPASRGVSMVRQGQQGTPCTQIHAAAGHALHAMASVLALASTQMGGEKL